jgi:hypothetical protein
VEEGDQQPGEDGVEGTDGTEAEQLARELDRLFGKRGAQAEDRGVTGGREADSLAALRPAQGEEAEAEGEQQQQEEAGDGGQEGTTRKPRGLSAEEVSSHPLHCESDDES